MKELHQRIAVIFSSFAALLLVWNVFTPGNPDHDLNVIEDGCLLVLFVFTYFSHRRPAEALQVLALVVVAFIPMGMDDSPFFGAVVAVFALILIYAYGGYRSRPGWKYFTTNAGLFLICSMAMSHFEAPSLETYGRAGMWVIFINVFCFVLWLIVDHRERNGTFAKEVVEQNHKLLLELKAMQGGADGNADRKDRST